MIMNKQHTDQHLHTRQHDKIRCSFVGPAPLSPPAATKVFIIHLLLLLMIWSSLNWEVGGKGLGSLPGFFVLN